MKTKLPPKKSICTVRNASVLILVILCASALTAQAQPGDVAKGKIVSEGDKTLVLDTEPCNKAAGRNLTFTAPYVKRMQKSATCTDTGSSYEVVEVEQLAADDKNGVKEGESNKEKEKSKPNAPDKEKGTTTDQPKADQPEADQPEADQSKSGEPSADKPPQGRG